MKAINFLKKEKVFTIALILAAVSCFFVPPDAQYAEYIDFRTLGLLFTLMLVVQGLADANVFKCIVNSLLKKVKTARALAFILVFICFFLSMVITNDVALITFVPFALAALYDAGLEKYAIRIVVLQTIAANLGSALTPIGNPQNLYLFSKSGMSVGEFLTITLPLAGISFIVLLILVLFVRGEKITGNNVPDDLKLNKPGTVLYLVLFAASMLVVLRIVPFWYIMSGAALATVVFGRARLLKRVDYVLLLTFVGFFVFVGNMQRIPQISGFLANAVKGREILFSAGASQVISNVPAATLLAGFTDDLKGLVLGTNIGGLGTPIASMASLISYKLFAAQYTDRKGAYMKHFLIMNFVLLALFLTLYSLLYY